MGAVYCTIEGCSYPDNHNASGHCCSKCGKYGHNLCEKSNKYIEIKDIPENIQCTIPGCRNYHNHTNQGHQCEICKQYGHGQIKCHKSNNKMLDKCTLCEGTDHHAIVCMRGDPIKILGLTEGKIYVTIYAGMGCFNIYKRDFVTDSLDKFFMHNQAYGTVESSDVPKLLKFIQGYRPLRKIDILID